jgi:transposase InsO family protein
MKNGWPTKCSELPIAALQPYFRKQDSFSCIEGCIISGERTVIPEGPLRNKILKALHLAHPGMVRMKALSRQYVYWPGLDTDIEQMVRTCEECRSALKSPRKEELSPWPICTEPMERVHMDFAGPCEDGKTYLIFVDSYSKWPEVICMTATNCKTVIQVIENVIFSRFGSPKLLVTDNDTSFQSMEFSTFCKQHGIVQMFSPPYHPQSNGQAERMVDTFKRQMTKQWNETGWIAKWLRQYRTTPHEAINGRTPSEEFIGRNFRTPLSLLKVRKVDHKPRKSETEQARISYRDKMSKQFNSNHGARHSNFKKGDIVLLLNYRNMKKQWLKGEVIERVSNVSYRVFVPQLDRKVHRHANQMRLLTSTTVEPETPLPPPGPSIIRQPNSPPRNSPERPRHVHFNEEVQEQLIPPPRSPPKTPRRSNRTHKQPERLDPDPRKSRY